jgi:hypothetical protein
VQGLIVLLVSVSPTGDWTQAAAIMTFAIPVGLFIVVATWLYFLYTRPHAVPGHRELVAAGAGRHAVGGSGRHAVPPPPSSGPSVPPAQPPGGGAPGSGGEPGSGGDGNPGGTGGR